MDWPNERWVRLYTRDTADDLVLSWQAQGLWPLLLRKADRAGVIATNHGSRGIAALVRWPFDVVDSALPELLSDGRICECSDPRGYVIPNWTAAQETPSSDAQRKRDERERRSVRANDSVTKRDDDVTKRDEMSRPSHAASRSVTPRRDETSREETRPGGDVSAKPTSRPKSKPVAYTDPELSSVTVVLEKLSAVADVRYRGSKEHTRLIVARLRDGCTEMDLRQVIVYCADKLGWAEDPAMKPYLRPETLFGPQTHAKYLDPARTWFEETSRKSKPIADTTSAKEFDPYNSGLDPLQEPEWMTTT